MAIVRTLRVSACAAILAAANTWALGEISGIDGAAMPPESEALAPGQSIAPGAGGDFTLARLDPTEQLTLSRQYLAAAAPAQRRPLMRVLDRYGLASALDDLGIDIYGFIQVSYTYSFTDPNQDEATGPDPARHRIQGRMFDHHSNRLSLNRFDLFIQRAVDYRSGDWDWGFMLEQQYGIDAAMMHSNGLFDYDFPTYQNHAQPEYQYDLTQLYVDVGVPVGNGLRVRAGKFATLIGYESCDPTTRTSIQFYSRSYILTLGIPMYQTGIIATYDLSDNLTVNAGITRGWDQSIEDVNDAIDLLASVNYVVSDNLTVYGALSTGPQQPDDNDHWRTVLNGTIYYTPNREGPWVFALDTIFAWEDNQISGNGIPGSPNQSGFLRTASPFSYAQDDDDTPVGDTYWFGIAGFAAYRINPNLVAKARAEWFYDEGGTRWRLPINDPNETSPRQRNTFQAAVMNNPFVAVGDSYNSFEFTVGLDIVPFPNDAKELLVRPELRVDIADEDIFVNGDKSYQVTAAIDILYKF